MTNKWSGAARSESLLEQMVAAQQQTNLLLEKIARQQAMLIQALADDERDPDAEPVTYMDGTPVR